MLKLYCQSCGGLNVYTNEKPKFCQSCGNSFGSIAVPQKLKSQIKSNAAVIDEDVEIHEIPNIDGLLVDIDVRGPQTDTIGNLAQSQEGDGNLKYDVNNIPDPDYGMDDFSKEAGTLRPPS
tara:strand:- start:6246 stop:6608 length:363 start_codon:yes stop_codon:yes gene_type:complete